jgi:hypothetical protein
MNEYIIENTTEVAQGSNESYWEISERNKRRRMKRQRESLYPGTYTPGDLDYMILKTVYDRHW